MSRSPSNSIPKKKNKQKQKTHRKYSLLDDITALWTTKFLSESWIIASQKVSVTVKSYSLSKHWWLKHVLMSWDSCNFSSLIISSSASCISISSILHKIRDLEIHGNFEKLIDSLRKILVFRFSNVPCSLFWFLENVSVFAFSKKYSFNFFLFVLISCRLSFVLVVKICGTPLP